MTRYTECLDPETVERRISPKLHRQTVALVKVTGAEPPQPTERGDGRQVVQLHLPSAKSYFQVCYGVGKMFLT